MSTIHHQQVQQDVQPVQAQLEELVKLIARVVREDGSAEPLKGLRLNRASTPKEPLHSVYNPVFVSFPKAVRRFF